MSNVKGWDYADAAAAERDAPAQARGKLLRELSPKARRIAGMLFDADDEVREEVLTAFDAR